MKRKIAAYLLWLMMAALPAVGQEKLYPVRGTTDSPVLLTSDRSAIVVERAFHHKLTIGLPAEDRLSVLPDTRTSMVVLSLRIQNVSQRPFELNTLKFMSMDEEGRTYPALAPLEAFNRMMDTASGDSIGSKTLRSLSLGRAGDSRGRDDIKEDIVRYSLHSGEIPPGGVREGLIYFEGPARKKFNVRILLGDLWSRPLLFSTEKQR